ncbi:MAG TPA: hypothetical protein VMY88_06960, partial [Acidimicrobiales bacterium]|nr:hypothetical protein [Acidimicrobiales bacterium]
WQPAKLSVASTFGRVVDIESSIDGREIALLVERPEASLPRTVYLLSHDGIVSVAEFGAHIEAPAFIRVANSDNLAWIATGADGAKEIRYSADSLRFGLRLDPKLKDQDLVELASWPGSNQLVVGVDNGSGRDRFLAAVSRHGVVEVVGPLEAANSADFLTWTGPDELIAYKVAPEQEIIDVLRWSTKCASSTSSSEVGPIASPAGTNRLGSYKIEGLRDSLIAASVDSDSRPKDGRGHLVTIDSAGIVDETAVRSYWGLWATIPKKMDLRSETPSRCGGGTQR